MPWSCGLQIKISSGPGRGMTLPLDTQSVKIGRARNPGDRNKGWILLNDDAVSRVHAELIWDETENAFKLYHRSETNLTWVNGEPAEEVVLKVGDEIKVGRVTLDVQKADTRWAGAPSEGAAPVTIPGMEGGGPAKRPPLRNQFRVPEPEAPPRPGPPARLGPQEFRLVDQADESSMSLRDTSHEFDGGSLEWDELAGAYMLTAAESSPIKVVREIDGVDWTTEAGDGVRLKLEDGDRLLCGDTLYRLEAVAAPASAGVRRVKLD